MMKNKGSSTVPVMVALFALTVVVGTLSTGTTIEFITNQASSASQASDVDWVKRNVVSAAVDMCQESGIQGPVPSDSNMTRGFNNLNRIETDYDSVVNPRGPSTYSRDLLLNYSSSEENVVFSRSTGSGYNTLPCSATPSINGTTQEGNSASTVYPGAGDGIDITTDGNLKFRIFETSASNVTIQVRQD